MFEVYSDNTPDISGYQAWMRIAVFYTKKEAVDFCALYLAGTPYGVKIVCTKQAETFPTPFVSER